MIIITGTVAYDYIMDFPDNFGSHILPDQIDKLNLSFAASKFERRRGGSAGNLAYALGLLKTPHTLFTVAGKDFQDYKKAFDKLKISLKNVVIDKSSYTSTGFGMTDKNNNQIWGYFLGASEKIESLRLKKVAKKGDLVLLGSCGIKGTISLIKQCVDLSIPYIFDLGFTINKIKDKDLEFGVKHASYIIGNDYEVTFVKRKIKNWAEIVKNKIIITTFGRKGALINALGEKYKILAAKPRKIIDPSGAGDAWRGGFLAGLHLKFDLQVCGQMGSVASVYAIENYGSQEYKYTKKEFENRYKQNFRSSIRL